MRFSVRFRFLDAIDGWAVEGGRTRGLKAQGAGAACSTVEVYPFVTRGSNVLPTLVGCGVTLICSSSEEVSGDRSDSSSVGSGLPGPANSLSTSSLESAAEGNGVNERALRERLVLIVSTKSSAVLTANFFGLWELRQNPPALEALGTTQ